MRGLEQGVTPPELGRSFTKSHSAFDKPTSSPITAIAFNLHDLQHPNNWTFKLLPEFLTNLRLAVEAMEKLPLIQVKLKNDVSGAAIKHALSARVYGLRTSYATTVLELPTNPLDYTKGRVRQALRTNVTKTKSLGMFCERVVENSLKLQLEKAVRNRITFKYLNCFLEEPDSADFENWVGCDRNGNPIAFARLQLSGDTALLKILAAVEQWPGALIRWDLSATIYQSLSRRGIKHVIEGSALSANPGTAYFQDRLGFRIKRVEYIMQ